MMRAFRALFEIGGILNDVLGALLGLAFVAFGCWADQFWLVPLGGFGISISLYRFCAHLSQWRRASNE